MKIRTLDTVDEAGGLEGLLSDYIHFVCSDIEAAVGVVYDPAVLSKKTMETLHKVVPPEGRTFVAEDEACNQIGMVFLRTSGAGAMEIKRLYVRPEGRGTGAGRALVEAAMAEARRAGASVMRLDTSKTFDSAIGLYRSMGFAFCDPYPESDHYDDLELSDVLVFMEKSLV